jgi:hypothetical protein
LLFSLFHHIAAEFLSREDIWSACEFNNLVPGWVSKLAIGFEHH